MRTVAIAGVGLIGGSFGLALRAAGFEGRIIGVSSPATIAKATARGAIDGGATLEEAAAEAGLMLLAQPISIIGATLDRLRGSLKPGALVTDAGSTKRRIVARGRAALGAQFLGGHPMAGKETRGVEMAEAGLFRGRPWLLTPEEPGQLEAAREFIAWLERIGARVTICTPEEHDRRVARSSHVPQLASTALASMLEDDALRDAIIDASGPGLAGMTRLALSAWPIWQDILDTNGDCIAEALDEYRAQLEATLDELRRGTLERRFAAGASFAARLPRGANGG